MEKAVQVIIGIAQPSVPPRIGAVFGFISKSANTFLGISIIYGCGLIFTGCGNFHGPFEYASIDVMEKAVQVIIGIAQEVIIQFKLYDY
jgi:acetylornithine deacetylase/succinyl-diaminopimelate desuccinylase-like protein